MPQSLGTFSKEKNSPNVNIKNRQGRGHNTKPQKETLFDISNTRRQIFAGSLSPLVKTINPQNRKIIARSISKDVNM